jgi:uncharacterized membrane protein YesL
MNTEKLLNSKIYQILDFVMRLVILNVLIVFVSLPLFTLLAAITSGHDVVRKMAEDRGTSIFKEFFKTFIQVLGKTAIVSLFMIIVLLIFVNSGFFFFHTMGDGIIYGIGFLLTISVGFVLIACMQHLPIVISYFPDLRTIDSIKLMFLFSARYPTLTAYLLLPIIIFFVEIGVFYGIVAFLGFSLPIYVGYLLSYRSYRIIYEKNKGE